MTKDERNAGGGGKRVLWSCAFHPPWPNHRIHVSRLKSHVEVHSGFCSKGKATDVSLYLIMT